MSARKRSKTAADASLAPPASDRSLGRFTGYLMKRAFNVVQEDLRRVLAPFGLRMLSFSTLVVVVDNPDITQTQLALALSIERSNIVVLLDELEEAGLLSRNAAPGDRRAYALRATLAGRLLAEKALDAVQKHESRLFAGLSAEDLETVRTALARIAGA